MWLRSLLALPLLSLLAPGATGQDPDESTTLTLRAGVVKAAPFALVDDTTGAFSGFHVDLLRYLSQLARQDNRTLVVELAPAPQNYGGALDLVAHDCNTTANPRPRADCERYDIIIADYYVNADRSMRVDFSPVFLQSSMATIKTVKGDAGGATAADDYTTLSQLEAGGGTVCLPEGTMIATVVAEKIPAAHVNLCAGGAAACIEELKAGRCALFVEDELQLRYRAIQDPALQLPGENFNTQYIVWAMRQDLPAETSALIKKWMFKTVADTTMDDLYYKYFAVKLCPLGKAGPLCDKDCDPNHGASDRYGKCQCHSTKFVGDECSVEAPEDLHLIPRVLVVLGYVMFGVNTALCAGCAAWLYWKRASHLVKAMQPLFLCLVLLGCVISTSCIVAMAQESPGDGPVVACAFIPWLFTVGHSITFGTLFAKILRVYRLFRAAANMERLKLTASFTLSNICAITSVDVIICLVWTVVDPMHWTREVLSIDKFGTPLESQGYCTSNHWIAFASTIAVWHLFILGVALILCYQSRNVSSKFSEAKPLIAVMVSQFQVLLVSVPVLIIVGAEGSSSFFVRSAVIWLNDFSVVAIIFGNLIYSVHKTNSQNPDIGAALKEFTSGAAVKKFTRAEGESSAPNSRLDSVPSVTKVPEAVNDSVEEEKEEIQEE